MILFPLLLMGGRLQVYSEYFVLYETNEDQQMRDESKLEYRCCFVRQQNSSGATAIMLTTVAS
jgi:hypothetical protein